MVDPGELFLKGYDRQSSLKFSGSKDNWPSYRWQFLAIVASMGDGALDVLEASPADVIAKKTADLTRIKAEAKGSQQQVDDIKAAADTGKFADN